ncbi:MAG: glycosyltransferase family 39 protein [Acidobacteriota bacterium]
MLILTERGAAIFQWIVCLAAAAFVGTYLFIAVHRLAYPFDLEWLEGAMVSHVWQLLAGKPIYSTPTLDFTPFLYPPLFYLASALVAKMVGIGFLPLRLVSLVSSIVVFRLVYRLVERDTGSRYSGAVALGMFAATYRLSGAWLDLARNDSLFLALLLAGVYLLRFRESRAGWAAAGALLALSVLTKQTAAFISVPLFLYAAIVDWRRGVLLVLAFGGLLTGVIASYHLRDHGWFLYYVVWLPHQIQMTAADPAPFWSRDILAPLPIASALSLAALLAARPRRARDAFWPLVGLGCLVAAWISRLHVGASENVLIPAHVGLALLTGLASRRLPDLATAGWRPLVGLAVAVMCIVQLAVLRYPVRAQIPTGHDRALAHELGVKIAEAGGEVFVPFHAFVPTPAGPVMHAHAWALFDVLRAGGSARSARLQGQIDHALNHGKYRMIVFDRVDKWMEPALSGGYRREGHALRNNEVRTRTSYITSPRWIFVPKSPRAVRRPATRAERARPGRARPASRPTPYNRAEQIAREIR